MEKPESTWQQSRNGVLTVHVSDDPKSDIYFEGRPEWYDGSAVKQEKKGYRVGNYKRYMEFIEEFGEHTETTKERLACYKTVNKEA